MKVFTAFSAPLRRFGTRQWTTGWTCANCRTASGRLTAPLLTGTRGFASSRVWTNARGKPRNARNGFILLASGGGAAAAGALAFTDDIKHGYEAAERAGRVAAALAVCINEYADLANDGTHPPFHSERTVLMLFIPVIERR